MGGKSTSTQETTQSSTTNPWAPAQSALTGILGQLNSNLGNTGITGAENSALNSMSSNANSFSQFSPQINNVMSGLLSGGGANAQAPMVNQSLADYQRRLNPIADGANIGPEGNPALRGYLDTISNDVQNRVNGMFAGAGRDLSGANQGTLARGIAEGTAPILASQYNTDFGNMRSAADALYGAGNTTAGLLTGMNQQGVANQQAGVQLAPSAFEAQQSGARGILEAESLRRGIPVEALGLLAQIGIPIAGLGGTQTGTGTTTGTNQMSGAQQFGMIAGGIGNLMPKFPIKFG